MPERKRILLADDDPLVRSLLRAVLQDPRFEVEEARDGDDAVLKARGNPPDLVVLDVMMPGMDGFEVCRVLRRDPSTRHAQIVMLTARGGTEDRAKARDAGADAFFTKPFSPLQLLRVLTEGERASA